MEFSEFFLNKLLEGAVSFYRNNKDIYVNPIPEKFKNIDESIQFFKNALVKEAHNFPEEHEHGKFKESSM